MTKRIRMVNSCGEEMDVMPVGTRVYCPQELRLLGTVVKHEFHESGKVSPLPYLVGWDDHELARKVIGHCTCYPRLDQLAPLDEMEQGCPYKRECATIIHWSEEKVDFVREVCITGKYVECLHYSASLKPQHDERERLYGDPHAHEPDWDEVGRAALSARGASGG